MDGHHTQPAFSAEDALSLAQSFTPDFVLLDIGLPRIDGYEVARRLRRSLLRTVTLVALTGYGQAEDRERAQAAGFDAHLVKPVDLAALTRTTGPIDRRRAHSDFRYSTRSRLLVLGEIERTFLVVVLHHVSECLRAAVMEVRRMVLQAAQRGRTERRFAVRMA